LFALRVVQVADGVEFLERGTDLDESGPACVTATMPVGDGFADRLGRSFGREPEREVLPLQQLDFGRSRRQRPATSSKRSPLAA